MPSKHSQTELPKLRQGIMHGGNPSLARRLRRRAREQSSIVDPCREQPGPYADRVEYPPAPNGSTTNGERSVLRRVDWLPSSIACPNVRHDAERS
jgi:hypothetical protein